MKSILITGAGSGIGRATAVAFASAGWSVGLVGRRRDALEETAKRAGGGLVLAGDVTKPDQVEAIFAGAVVQFGRLDALFNNGAFACPGAVEDLPRGALREIFETNLFGYHDLTRRVIPVMRAQGHGRIVNCSSVLGLVGMTWRGAYVATKFAMEGLTDVLRIEMKGTGIEVILIEPGPIATRIRENAVPHFERWIDWENSARRDQYVSLRGRLYGVKTKKDAFELGPEAVTAKLIRALEDRRPKPRYYVTTPTYLMGFLRRLLPTRALDWLIAKG